MVMIVEMHMDLDLSHERYRYSFFPDMIHLHVAIYSLSQINRRLAVVRQTHSQIAQ